MGPGVALRCSPFSTEQVSALRPKKILNKVGPPKDILSESDNEYSPTRISAKGWYPFLALAMILIAHRLSDLISDRDPGVLFKLLPVLFVVAVFTYLRENHFKINVALKLEGE